MYDRIKAEPFVVKPSIPILYFGDSQAYFTSRLKVITVGLNPSRVEFPEGDRFQRFPAAENIEGYRSNNEVDAVTRQALDDYFRNKPYREWFDPSFELLLNGLGASYYGKLPNTALHTDIGSPVATDPTWTRLRDDQRTQLQADGIRLWHRLVEVLEPDVIVISVARHHLNKIQFPLVGQASVLHTLPYCDDGRLRHRPYIVEQQWRQLPSGKRALLVFGQAAEKPFGTVSSKLQQQIGRVVKEVLDAR